MTTYLRILHKHKRRRVAFQEDQYMGYGDTCLESNSVLDSNNSADDDIFFSPEIMFMMNCVPDSALPPTTRVRDKKTIEFYGVLDTQPQEEPWSGTSITDVTKGIAQLLAGVGFEGATEAPVKVFSQFLSCHISKLGRNPKVLTDNYRKQCSAIELIWMFLQTSGYSNFGTLAELVKDSTGT
ncbi:hypothetical protein CRYUN_Cryun22dG0079800 [Craigia yunnanensis]